MLAVALEVLFVIQLLVILTGHKNWRLCVVQLLTVYASHSLLEKGLKKLGFY